MMPPRPQNQGGGLTAGGSASLSVAASNAEFRTVEESADREANSGSNGLHLAASLERMPVSLSVSIPVRDFRVRNLLALRSGELIETQWANGEDLPLSSGAVQLAWSEFEVVDTRLAVRVTRLA
jgi:flagellar motor switch protein FliN/FliY